MPDRRVWTVFRKEFTDILRDSKTWISTFVIPLLVFPFVVFLLSSSLEQVERQAREHIPLAVIGEEQDGRVAQALAAEPGVELRTVDDPLAAVRSGQVRAVVQVPEDFAERLSRGETADLDVWYDVSDQKSLYAQELIARVVERLEQEETARRLEAAGLPPETVQPFKVNMTSVTTEERQAGSMLASIVPLMLLLAVASGGIPAATDLVAGERERGTLEPLICTPVSAGSILTAKLLAVMMMGGISAIASAISMSVAVRFLPMQGENTSLHLGFLTPAAIAVMLVMLLLLAALFAGIELLLSTMARSFREAQIYMTPVVFLAIVPNYMMMPLTPADLPLSYYLLPIFNGAAIFKEVFFGELDPVHVLLAFISGAGYVALVVAFAARMFRRERLLTGR